jgi:uncharacterized protein (DUF58 family)
MFLISDLYLSNRFYAAMIFCIMLLVCRFFVPELGDLPYIFLQMLAVLIVIDYVLLFFFGKCVTAERIAADRFSNGDFNTVHIKVQNKKFFALDVEIIDELPVQFQERNWKRYVRIAPHKETKITYSLRPVERGEYQFGNILLYAKTLLGLVIRRHSIAAAQMIPVYPSFLQMRKYELLSQATLQTESGSKRLRKIGHSMEFEQIKEYVRGDDIRTLNWKATARKGSLMVNTFTDEKSQQVFLLIDKGRLMKMPFSGLTLLDYAINSALVLSNVCLQKQDRVGLITFSNKMGSVLAADRKPIQKENLLQILYNQKTGFLESDYEMLYMQLRSRIKHRSLLVLFTNFESLSGLKRQLEYLRSLAKHHLLVVVFFENTELHQLTRAEADTLEEVYIKTIAEKFAFEKRLIVKELMKHGILSVLTSPEKLTVDILNKYLELKARQAL